MPIGLIPALILGGATAGAQVTSAVIGAKAATKAGSIQKAAEDRALALQQQTYNDAKTRYQPYEDVGTSVLPTLKSLAGNVQAPRYGTNLSQLSIYGQPAPMAPQGAAGGPRAMIGQGAPAMPVGAGQTPAAAAASGGTVMMRAPNGQQKAVPREQVAHYQSRGAQIVSGQ